MFRSMFYIHKSIFTVISNSENLISELSLGEQEKSVFNVLSTLYMFMQNIFCEHVYEIHSFIYSERFIECLLHFIF